MPLDNAAALDALRKVMDPELRRDLVTLGMIKDLAVEGDTVRLKVELTTPACPLKETIGNDVRRRAPGRRRQGGRDHLGRAGPVGARASRSPSSPQA